jgi:hypothetical protein
MNLAEGAYTIYYRVDDGFYMSKRENIKVASGRQTIVDTVVLKPGPRVYPPTPVELTDGYDTAAGIVHLFWRKVAYDNLRWYEVSRTNLTLLSEKNIICQDTVCHDTVGALAKGTLLNYGVRSIDRSSNPSFFSDPVEITVR